MVELSVSVVEVDATRVVIPATLRYDPADPLAVHLALDVGQDKTVVWTFARQLLADGALRPVGSGDVRVRPARWCGRPVLTVSLRSPSGEAELELPASRVAAFVHRTYVAVPAAMESDVVDWDAEFSFLRSPETS